MISGGRMTLAVVAMRRPPVRALLNQKTWHMNANTARVFNNSSHTTGGRLLHHRACCALKPNTAVVTKATLWACEAVYVGWLFLLPYAPGDPVWSISPATLHSLLALSLNFFLILPLLNACGIHLIEAPLQHPVCEGLFNFVIAWTFMFAPLLFTDRRRHSWARRICSLDLLWGLQMFLTNTFLIPYMAVRLDDPPTTTATTPLASLMTRGSSLVGLTGASVCVASLLWGLFGRPEFGDVPQRCHFLLSYIGSERLAYAFVWDICLYAVFQPWLIGDNLHQSSNPTLLRYLRFVPVLGLLAYLVSLHEEHK